MSFVKVIPGSKLSANTTDPGDQQGMLRQGVDGNIYEYVFARSTFQAGFPAYRVSQLGAANGSTNGMITPTQGHASMKKAYGVAQNVISTNKWGYILKRGIPAHLRTKSTATLKGLTLNPYLKLFSNGVIASQFCGHAFQSPASSDLAYGSYIQLL